MSGEKNPIPVRISRAICSNIKLTLSFTAISSTDALCVRSDCTKAPATIETTMRNKPIETRSSGRVKPDRASLRGHPKQSLEITAPGPCLPAGRCRQAGRQLLAMTKLLAFLFSCFLVFVIILLPVQKVIFKNFFKIRSSAGNPFHNRFDFYFLGTNAFHSYLPLKLCLLSITTITI